MASLAQIAANRRNARRSTGPRTAEGKAVASRNSFKHGLTASKGREDSKRGAPYRRHRARLLADLAPVGPDELRLAERVVRLSWQLKRAERAESWAFEAVKEKLLSGTGDFELASEPGTSTDWTGIGRLERLQSYEQRAECDLFEAMEELRQMRSAAEVDSRADLAQA